MKKILITFLLFFLIPSFVVAQDQSVDELLGDTEQNEEQEVLNEEERKENLENELNISIPEYTDNPSHAITFIDPSEDSVGVEIDINEGGYRKITSPYSLPALTIGTHKLKFRFVDSFGARRVLDYSIVILPRPPILKAPFFEENNLIISGTGLANSEIVVTVSVNAVNFVRTEEIDGDGSWELIVPMETISNGIYTIFAYTRRNGFASNPSEPAVMSVGDGEVISNRGGDSSTQFSLTDISLEDLPTILLENPTLLLLSIGIFLLGGLIAALLIKILRRNPNAKEERYITKKIRDEKKERKEEKTLLELFGEEKKDSKKGGKVKKKKEKKKKKEAVFSKKDFLKDFEKFDPDKDSGEEKEPPKKKDKKEVLVSLTSKVEEEE